MARRITLAATASAAAALFIAFPAIHGLVVLLNFIVHMAVMAMQLIGSKLPRPRLKRRAPQEAAPFVSVHVPAHNEPPDLLKQTLLSLSQLEWEHYEVLVIDNNTEDPALWEPVREYCQQLGPRFRFFHVENLPGFKAGALNHLRQFMDPRSKFIFVVDADYIVDPGALKTALSYWTNERTGLIQFPQDYRNIGPANVGIALDFKHFFSGYMTMANALDCVPSTGTLCLINVAALRAIGGFRGDMITEDADLGLRLSLGGYRSKYVNRTIGRGVMPHDLEGLKKQRWRWAFGNAQILKLNWRRILLSRELTIRQKLGFLTHLTAWLNFNIIPGISLLLLAPLAWFNLLTPVQDDILILSAATVTTYIVMRFGTIYYSLRRDGCTLREIWLAYLTHIGMGWTLGASWLKCLWDDHEPFVRTNKFVKALAPDSLRSALFELIQAACFLAICPILAAADFMLAPMAAFLMGLSRLMILWVWQQTRETLRLSSVRTDGAQESGGAETAVLAGPAACETPGAM